jgi:putative Holliday junction resolvase
MALDHGTKKIGIAFSDEMEIIASPFDIWHNDGVLTITKLAELAMQEEVKSIVIGLPLHKDGNHSSTAELAMEFGKLLQEQTKLPLIFWNEHLTSQEAKCIIAQHKQKTKNKKIGIDAIAAAILLQDLIATRRTTDNQVAEDIINHTIS